MKINLVTQTNRRQLAASRAFTLIEMIGVLAVIAILAALLIPKVFSAINDARVNNCVVSYNTIKTAVVDHYGKYSSLSVSNTTALTLPATNFDGVLLGEGLIDKPFEVKIGTSADIAVVATGGNNSSGFSLDGGGIRTTNQSVVVEAVVSGVSMQDAFDVSTRLDGASLTASNSTSADTIGRVAYAAAGTNGTTTMYIYITGR